MKISCIQSKRKFTYSPFEPCDFDKTRIMHYSQLQMDEGFEMIEQAGKEGSQLIVTIEGFNESVTQRDKRYEFLDFAEPLDGPIMDRFSKLAKKYNTYIVAGLYTRRDKKAYNSAVLLGPDGNIAGIYDKVHHPYDDDKFFTPGDSYPIFRTEFGNLGILICWDMQYPEAVREIALGGADIIACPTMGWEPIYGYCRAYENGVSLAIAMHIPYGRDLWEGCDPSCIVDNMGKIVASASRRRSEIVTADIDILAEPPPQYGSEFYTGMNSMRQIRMSQRRPDTYKLITDSHPPLLSRYYK
jgi:predicted amidohydrolase